MSTKHTVGDVLRMAGHLLADEKRHCVWAQAKNSLGRRADRPIDPQACQWCVMGGLLAAGHALGVFDLNAQGQKNRARQMAKWERVQRLASSIAEVEGPDDLVRVWNIGMGV